MFKSKNYFLSQPHQPFFLLSFVNAILLIIIFSLSMHGLLTLKINTSLFHSYGLIFLCFTPAFFGFLFTTFPRFLSVEIINKEFYTKIFTLFSIGNILFLIGSIYYDLLVNISMFIIFVGYLLSIKKLIELHLQSSAENKHDTFWILIGFCFGIISRILFLLSNTYITFISYGAQVGIYLYLFLVAFAVAQRMIPFFSHCQYEKDKTFLRTVVVLLSLHVVFEIYYFNLSFLVDAILAIIIAKEIYRWKLPFPNSNPMLWIMHLSLFWIPISFLFSSISSAMSYYYAYHFVYLGVHMLVLGFLLTILIGFGTRVTIGHSNNIMNANKLTISLFVLTQIVVLSRMIMSIAASMKYDFMILFDISIVLWVILFVVWLVQFFNALVFGKSLSKD
jgi:uncharacterized protein involved in response to NO